MAFRHIFSVGTLAKRQGDAQAQKAYRHMIFSVTKKADKQADKKK